MTLPGIARSARARYALVATASAISVLPLVANAETVANVDVSVGALAASNPYFLDGSDTEAGALSLSLRPYISITEENTTVTVDGTLSIERFFDNYGTDEFADVGASIEHRANERTTFTAAVGYQSSDSAARHFYGGAHLGGLEPGEFPDSSVVDPTLGNISGQTSRLDVTLGLQQAISSNAKIGLTAGIGLTRVEERNGSDYRDSRTSLSYSKQLNERTALLLSADVGYADYFGRRAGDGLFTTTLAGVDHKFSESMYGSLQVGFSYAAVNTLLGDREEVINWAASADICDMLARGTLCVSGSRSAQPTSLGGVTMVSSLGVSYARSIGAAGNISLGAGYSKTGMSDSPILLGRRESEMANVSGTYSHEIGERLSAFITPSLTSIDDEFAEKEENYQVLVGISYHFGKAP